MLPHDRGGRPASTRASLGVQEDQQQQGLAYSEIHDDEQALTCAGFLAWALMFFVRHGVVVERVMTANAFSYRRGPAGSSCLPTAVSGTSSSSRTARGPTARSDGSTATLQAEWAYRRPWTSNKQHRPALAPRLQHYNTQDPHTALQERPPISRVSTTERVATAGGPRALFPGTCYRLRCGDPPQALPNFVYLQHLVAVVVHHLDRNLP